MAASDSDGNDAFGNIISQLLCERGLGTGNECSVTVLLVNTGDLSDWGLRMSVV